MNELIKQLAKEHFVRDEHTEFGWQDCEKYVFDPDELEQFVKTIVQECADQVTHEGPFVAEVVWGKQFHRKILKHFGVE